MQEMQEMQWRQRGHWGTGILESRIYKIPRIIAATAKPK